MFAKLLFLFIAIPVAELCVFLTLGAQIGLVPTLLIIVATALLGAALTRAQGARAMVRYRQAIAEGRLPHEEVLDGVMILVAGVVLLTPGFLTDAFGFALLVPAVRGAVRKWLGRRISGHIHVGGTGFGGAGAQRAPGAADDVIDAEVEVEVLDRDGRALGGERGQGGARGQRDDARR